MWHLRARDLYPALGRFLSADPVQPCPEGSQPGTQGYNRYAYVANNPTNWVDPSGFSVARDGLTPAQATIVAGMILSLPAVAVTGGIGAGLFLFALVLMCGTDEECRNSLRDSRGLIRSLGSAGVNTVTWTAETLNTAFATYPLLPENSPALQVFAGVGLAAVGLDTVTDFAAFVSGRDPLTGIALTPRDRFYTSLAIGHPFVTAGVLRQYGDDTIELVSSLTPRKRIKYNYSFPAGGVKLMNSEIYGFHQKELERIDYMHYIMNRFMHS